MTFGQNGSHESRQHVSVWIVGKRYSLHVPSRCETLKGQRTDTIHRFIHVSAFTLVAAPEPVTSENTDPSSVFVNEADTGVADRCSSGVSESTPSSSSSNGDSWDLESVENIGSV